MSGEQERTLSRREIAIRWPSRLLLRPSPILVKGIQVVEQVLQDPAKLDRAMDVVGQVVSRVMEKSVDTPVQLPSMADIFVRKAFELGKGSTDSLGRSLVLEATGSTMFRLGLDGQQVIDILMEDLTRTREPLYHPELDKIVVGEDHPEARHARSGLIPVLGEAGRFKEAENELNKKWVNPAGYQWETSQQVADRLKLEEQKKRKGAPTNLENPIRLLEELGVEVGEDRRLSRLRGEMKGWCELARTQFRIKGDGGGFMERIEEMVKKKSSLGTNSSWFSDWRDDAYAHMAKAYAEMGNFDRALELCRGTGFQALNTVLEVADTFLGQGKFVAAGEVAGRGLQILEATSDNGLIPFFKPRFLFHDANAKFAGGGSDYSKSLEQGLDITKNVPIKRNDIRVQNAEAYTQVLLLTNADVSQGYKLIHELVGVPVSLSPNSRLRGDASDHLRYLVRVQAAVGDLEKARSTYDFLDRNGFVASYAFPFYKVDALLRLAEAEAKHAA